MIKGIKKGYLFFSTAFIFMLHLPVVFAKTEATNDAFSFGKDKHFTGKKAYASFFSVDNLSANLYDGLQLGAMGLAKQAFDEAYKGFSYLKETGKIINENILSIVDFSKPSSEKRLFVIDLLNMKVLFNTYVAHGVNSGKAFAKSFSNAPESNKSSLGFYETENTYMGHNGYSLHLQGLEKGINDNAFKREIVVHGAEYVNQRLINQRGYIGRSWGCPALPENMSRPIINNIKDGTCLFIFSNDKNYLSHSKLLKSALSQTPASNQ